MPLPLRKGSSDTAAAGANSERRYTRGLRFSVDGQRITVLAENFCHVLDADALETLHLVHPLKNDKIFFAESQDGRVAVSNLDQTPLAEAQIFYPLEDGRFDSAGGIGNDSWSRISNSSDVANVQPNRRLPGSNGKVAIDRSPCTAMRFVDQNHIMFVKPGRSPRLSLVPSRAQFQLYSVPLRQVVATHDLGLGMGSSGEHCFLSCCGSFMFVPLQHAGQVAVFEVKT